MMTTHEKTDRIKALRQDPDFRALVDALESQTPEQIEAFYSHYERSEHNEIRGTKDGSTHE